MKLPGKSTVEFHDFEVGERNYGQVSVKIKASSICGSDIRAIYRAHIGKRPEGYQPGTIFGHEPCGQIVKVGAGFKQLKVGDCAIIHHMNRYEVRENCSPPHGKKLPPLFVAEGAFLFDRDTGNRTPVTEMRTRRPDR